MNKIALAFLATVLLFSCSRIDEIDINSFNIPDNQTLISNVAVTGNVTTEMRQHSVTLSAVRQWNEDLPALPEINRVFVICETDTIPYTERNSSTNTKVFISEQPFQGEAGKTYKLVVETPTGDITAEDDLLPLGNTDYFQLMKDNTWIKTYQTPMGNTQYRINFSKHIYTLSEQPAIFGVAFYSPDFCPIDSLNYLTFVHSDLSLQALFSAQSFYYSYESSENGLQHTGDFITYSVSPEFYSYLLGAFNESDWSMGLFATISGNTQGNVKNGYGYFFASDVRRKSITFNELITENE